MTVESLFEDERKNRLENNHTAQTETFKALLETCSTPNDVIVILKLLSKKKNQIKITVRWLIDHVFEKYKMNIKNIHVTSDTEFPSDHVNFFKTILVDVIEGKLFLEQQRNDYAVYLRQIYEKFGYLEEALKITYDVPIETFSTLTIKDISEYQLEVMRLSILCRDKLRSEIMNRKIKEKWLNENEKIIFYFLKVDYLVLNENYYQAGMEIIKIMDNIEDKITSAQSVPFTHFYELSNNYFSHINNILCQHATLFLLISSQSSKRISALKSIKMSKFNNEKTRNLINSFISGDLVDKEKNFIEMKTLFELGRHKENLKKFFDFGSIIRYAIDHHNISILSNFFTSIKFQDLESLTMTPINIILEHICENINNYKDSKKIKIDQRREIVLFKGDIKAISVEETLKQLDSTVMWVVKERLRKKMMNM